MNKLFYFKVLSVLIGMFIALLFGEVGYRIYLFKQEIKKVTVAPTFSAISRSMSSFNKQFGYDYVEDDKRVRLKIINGKVKECSTAKQRTYTYTKLGNYGTTLEEYNKGEYKVLIFGDSWTALDWPIIFQEKLSEKLKKKVSTLNFARDGFGILQMVDSAAARVELYKPDLVIIAFITDDLIRNRTWRKEVEYNGVKFVMIASEPIEKYDNNIAFPFMLVDETITMNECLAAYNAGKPGMNRMYGRLIKNNKKLRVKIQRETIVATLMSLNQLFILNKILNATPFSKEKIVYHKQFKRVVGYNDFNEDKGFRENIVRLKTILKKFNIPILLIHLLEYKEMETGKYIFTKGKNHFIQVWKRAWR